MSLLIGFFIGFLIGIGTLPPSAQAIASVIELLLVLGGLAGTFIYGLIAKPKDEVLPE